VPAVRDIEALEEDDDDKERKTDGAIRGVGEGGKGGGRRRKATSLLEGLEDRLCDVHQFVFVCPSAPVRTSSMSA
jgi:hypothetical protein